MMFAKSQSFHVETQNFASPYVMIDKLWKITVRP